MDKYEVIIPERIYIVDSLTEAGMILDKHKAQGACIKLLNSQKKPKKKAISDEVLKGLV